MIAQKKNLQLEGCELIYESGIIVQHKKSGFGVHFFGENGEVKVNRGQFEVILGGKVVARKDDKTSVERAYGVAERDLLKDAKIKLYRSSNHIADFLDCVRSRKKPITHEGIGGGTSIVCNLMNIAYATGKPFKWDPKKHEFTGGTGDPKRLTREYRGEWTV